MERSVRVSDDKIRGVRITETRFGFDYLITETNRTVRNFENRNFGHPKFVHWHLKTDEVEWVSKSLRCINHIINNCNATLVTITNLTEHAESSRVRNCLDIGHQDAS
jgi:hypothetical protein